MKQENAVLYFWNASCTVCGPLYEKLKVLVETEFLELSLEKINTATNPELRAQYRVFFLTADCSFTRWQGISAQQW